MWLAWLLQVHDTKTLHHGADAGGEYGDHGRAEAKVRIHGEVPRRVLELLEENIELGSGSKRDDASWGMRCPLLSQTII